MDEINFKTLSTSEIKKFATLLINIQNKTPPQTLDAIVAMKLLNAFKLNKNNF